MAQRALQTCRAKRCRAGVGVVADHPVHPCRVMDELHASGKGVSDTGLTADYRRLCVDVIKAVLNAGRLEDAMTMLSEFGLLLL